MTYEQIAETIGIPVGTVKTRMRLALAKLREAVKESRPRMREGPRRQHEGLSPLLQRKSYSLSPQSSRAATP